MIIRTIATALVQCRARTQAGWMTFAVVALTWLSETVRLDMIDPSLLSIPAYTPGNRVSLLSCMLSLQCPQGIVVTKKRAGSPRLASRRASCRGQARRGRLRRRHQHGVDHVDHAVGLVDVRDRDHRGSTLGVDDPDLVAIVLHRQLFAFGRLELHAVLQV